MNEDTGVHYLTPWQINETIEGLGGIGEIIEIHGIFFFYLHFMYFFFLEELRKFTISDFF